MRAKTLADILRVADPSPLNEGNFDEYYVDCSLSRGDDAIKKLETLFLNSKDSPQKILFYGHKGCGKSTELVRLIRKIKNDFFIVNYSISDELDLYTICYEDLIFESMRQLYEQAAEQGLKLKDDVLDDIYKWLSSIEIQEIKNKTKGVKAEVGIGGRLLPWLFSEIKGHIQFATQVKETVTTFLSRRFSEFSIYCNILIREVSKLAQKPVLIIIEDLDKADLDKGQEIFLNHPRQITSLDAHMIYTIPVPLIYSPSYRTILSYFEAEYALPMIKIKNIDGTACTKGQEYIKKIINKRLDLSLLGPGVLDKLIEKSGGVLRGLVDILKDTALNALSENTTITMETLNKSLDKARNTFKHSLSGPRVDEYYNRLEEVCKNKKNPKQDHILMELLHGLCVLQYNGKTWYDVHPLVKEIVDGRRKSRKKDNG